MKCFLFFILIISITISTSVSQSQINNQTIQDSLLQVISSQKNPQALTDAYLELIRLIQVNDASKAIEFSQKAIEIAKSMHDEKTECYLLIEASRCYSILKQHNKALEIINSLAKRLENNPDHELMGKFYMAEDYVFSKIGNYDQATSFSYAALKEYTLANDTNGLSKVYYNIALNYDQVGNYKKALECYIISKNFAQAVNNKFIIKDATINIGTIYDMLDENEKALDYYFQALNLNNKLNDENGTVLALNNVGSICIEMKQYDDGLGYLKKAIKINQKLNQPSEDAILNYNIGDLFLRIQKFDSSGYYLKKSITLYQKMADTAGLTDATILLGDCFFQQKLFIESTQKYLKARSMAVECNSINLQKKALSKLAYAYNALGNNLLAFEYLSQAEVIGDSILLSERRDGARNTEIQLNLKEKTTLYEGELNQLRNANKSEELRRHNERLAFFTSLGLIIIVVVIFLWSFLRTRSINNQLLRKNREIQEQKELIEISNTELKEQYIFTETLLNTIPNPVFYTDKNFRILGFNQAFEKICGRTPDQLIGTPLLEVSTKSKLKCDFEQMCGQLDDKHIRHEGNMIFADNETHDVIYYNNQITDNSNRPLGRLGIIIDITDLRQFEKTLKESKDQLREALNAKDKFFNIVAHDLKNPFNAILGLTNFVSENYENHTPEEIRKFFSLINTSSNHVYNLLDNLLEWARAQSGSIEKVPIVFLITEPINECIVLLNHSLDSKKIKVSINADNEYSVFADKNMILTVLRNLIGNAVKYTPEEGKIEIRITSDEKMVYISVVDSGIGIPNENIGKLFKIDQPVTTPGLLNEKGTGLGLIICKEFIKLNDGDLTVESQLNSGSVFTFSLKKA